MAEGRATSLVGVGPGVTRSGRTRGGHASSHGVMILPVGIAVIAPRDPAPPAADATLRAVESDPRPRPSFAHASEAEMARILDFYRIRWEYEPHTFPILWNLDGSVIESFSPDFWLPDLELYLEMTTLRQKLVRKKNRKLRRIRELYPDIRVKLFYARDFRALMLKFGRLAVADALSGSSGQVVPDRAGAAIELLERVGPDLALDPQPGGTP